MNNTTISKLGSLAAFGLAVVGLLILIYKKNILSDNPIGIIVQVCAAGLMFWARFTFGVRSFHAVANTTKGRLVTNGPYRFLRHPIYASIIYFVWAGVLSYLNITAIAAALFVSVGLITRMLIEEKFLMATYEEYKAYSKSTFRVIPFLF
jgi:protein-S-isoprenylcysteine O-methyltransferase Ste14